MAASLCLDKRHWLSNYGNRATNAYTYLRGTNLSSRFVQEQRRFSCRRIRSRRMVLVDYWLSIFACVPTPGDNLIRTIVLAVVRSQSRYYGVGIITRRDYVCLTRVTHHTLRQPSNPKVLRLKITNLLNRAAMSVSRNVFARPTYIVPPLNLYCTLFIVFAIEWTFRAFFITFCCSVHPVPKNRDLDQNPLLHEILRVGDFMA